MTFDQFRFSDTWFPEFKQPLVTKSNFVKNYQFFQKEKEKKKYYTNIWWICKQMSLKIRWFS